MYALRERRVHVTQEDFEMAVTKVGSLYTVIFKPLLRNHQSMIPFFCHFAYGVGIFTIGGGSE